MAMSDLIIWPRTKTLRYASGKFDELRLLFSDIMERKDVSPAVYEIAVRGKGRCISAKATVDNGIDDAVAIAVAASVDRSPEGGNRETGCHAKHESAVGSEANETPRGSRSSTPQEGSN